MIIQPWSPDPDKYAGECEKCMGAGVIAWHFWRDIPDSPFRERAIEDEACEDCQGTGMVVDWQAVEPALLGGRS